MNRLNRSILTPAILALTALLPALVSAQTSNILDQIERLAARAKETVNVTLAIISAEPKELTIVSIDGAISLAQLAGMGGQFGIPKIEK